MMSFCWCGKRMVLVTPELVKAGRTLSCGRECDPLHAVAPTVDTAMSRSEASQLREQKLRAAKQSA